MNPHDHLEASWMFLFATRAVEWLHPIVYIVGLAVAVWAFRCCRRRGYLVIGFYFLLVLFTLFAMPSINRASHARRAPDVSQQIQQKINAAVQQAIDRVLEEEGQAYAPPLKRTVQFPFGPMVLVLGLWLIARRDIEEHRANHSAASNPLPAGESDGLVGFFHESDCRPGISGGGR